MPDGTSGGGSWVIPAALLEGQHGAVSVEGRRCRFRLAEDVVEDLEGGTVVADAQHVPQHAGDVEAALAREAVVAAAPLQYVHRAQQCVGQLEEEDLLPGDVLATLGVAAAGEDVEGVQAGGEGGIACGLDDVPGVVVGADVAAPSELLVDDADAELLGQVGEPAQLLGSEVVVEGERENAGVDEDGVRAEASHEFELVAGAAQSAGELGGGPMRRGRGRAARVIRFSRPGRCCRSPCRRCRRRSPRAAPHRGRRPRSARPGRRPAP